MSPTLAFIFGNMGPMELLILAFIALLLFGKRLPEVMRSMGKGITEFKKGMNGIEDEIGRSTGISSSPTPYHEPARPLPSDERHEVTAPKFQPPTSAPTEPHASNPTSF
jgi:sec-independent protein translocase protein TatA